ncbi:nitrilase-related carbon-nitrogen hydrolase [Burkholderia sp. JPY481]|uniref:nitrilase-related carbon-nitrogen hydrolase n=1 Tax=Paraburkholderia sp. JPY465 TaxID=3042285 RepID=UPI00317EB123
MSASMLRVAAVPLELSCRGIPPQVTRVSLVAERLARAAREGIGLAVFPEACLVECASLAKLRRREVEALAEPLDGPSVSAVAEAVEATGVAAGVGLFERAPDGRIFNSYVICLPGGIRHCHRKLHAFEHRRVECGDRFTVFDTAWGVRIGVLIGADNYLIENVRMNALMGATLLVAPHRRYLSASQSDERDSIGALRRWMPARAADNGMFVAFSGATEGGCEKGNEKDKEKGNENIGETDAALIVDPCGRVLADSVGRESAFVSAELDTALIGESAGRRWLESRRPELYGPLARAAGAARAMPPHTAVAARGGAVPLSVAVVGRDRLTVRWNVR